MFVIKFSNKFNEDAKLLKKRSQKDAELLKEFLKKLAKTGNKGLEKKHKAHKLSGNYAGYWECHVKPDLLLIWDENEEILLAELIRTGSHSDLFYHLQKISK